MDIFSISNETDDVMPYLLNKILYNSFEGSSNPQDVSDEISKLFMLCYDKMMEFVFGAEDKVFLGDGYSENLEDEIPGQHEQAVVKTELFADVLLNVYIHHKWNISELQPMHTFLKENEKFSLNYTPSNLSRALKKEEFTSSHPYAFYLGLDSHKNNQKYKFRNCFAEIQLLLLRERKRACRKSLKKDKMKFMKLIQEIDLIEDENGCEKMQVNHMKCKSYYEMEKIMNNMVKYYTEVKECILQETEEQNNDIKNLVTLFLSEKVWSADILMKVERYLYEDYSFLIKFGEFIQENSQDNNIKSLCKIYNNAFRDFSYKMDCCARVSGSPLVFSRDRILEKVEQLLYNDLDVSAGIYSGGAEGECGVVVCEDYIDEMNFKFAPLLGELFYQKLLEIYGKDKEKISNKLEKEIANNQYLQNYLKINMNKINEEDMGKPDPADKELFSILYSRHIETNTSVEALKEKREKLSFKFILNEELFKDYYIYKIESDSDENKDAKSGNSEDKNLKVFFKKK